MASDYTEISKQIGKLTISLMEYRYHAILKNLLLIKNKDKSKRLLKLELELNCEIHKVIQNHTTINDILDEIEALI